MVSDDSSDWLTLDEAHKIAVEKGYSGGKDAFRKAIARKPDEMRLQYRIVHEPSRAGKGGGYKPYRRVD